MLTNSPPQEYLRLEARKTFSLGMRFVDSSDMPVDISENQLAFNLNQPDWKGGASILTKLLEIVDGPDGLARLVLDTTETDLAAGEYDYAFQVATPELYIAALLKGTLEIVDNAGAVGIGGYTGGGLTTALAVKLGDRQHITFKQQPLSPPGDKGDQGEPGWAGTLLLESNQNLSDIPPDTPVGTIIYRKA